MYAQSTINVSGRLSLVLTSEDGAQHAIELGSNTLCQPFLNALSAWSTGANNTGQNPTSPPVSFILGTGTGTPSVSDAALFAPQTGTQTTISTRTASGSTTTYSINYTKGQLTGTFTEGGLQDNSNNLMSHLVFQSSVNILNTEAATFIYTITFNAG